MKAVFTLFSCLLLAACVTETTEKYDLLLNNWLNKNEIDLVSSWGAPDKVYQVANKKFISYYSQHNQYVSRTVYHYQPFYTAGWPYFDPINDTAYQVITQICKTTFMIENDKIVNWTHQGDGCIAK